jgi:hypothetical protein
VVASQDALLAPQGVTSSVLDNHERRRLHSSVLCCSIIKGFSKVFDKLSGMKIIINAKKKKHQRYLASGDFV